MTKATVEYIARETLVINEDYPFEHWMFIWCGEVVRVSINKDMNKIVTKFEDTMPAEEVFPLKNFVNQIIREIHDASEDEPESDPEDRD